MPINHVDPARTATCCIVVCCMDGNCGKRERSPSRGSKSAKDSVCYHPRATCIQWTISSFDLVVHRSSKSNLIIRIFSPFILSYLILHVDPLDLNLLITKVIIIV
jgi:hypothetical protein